MKLLSALCTATLLAATHLPAQEPAASAPAPDTVPAAEAAAETEAVVGSDAAVSSPAPADPATPIAPQSSAVPEPTLDLMPAQPSPTLPVPDATGPEPSLIPEAPTTTEKPRGSAIEQPRPGTTAPEVKKDKKSATELSTGELHQRIRFRQARTRALGDPAIQAEWRQAETARTDFEKRAALKRYYTLLYTRMGRLDASIKKDAAERQRIALRRLEQTRIEGTEQPLDAAERTVRLDQD
jgi:hypothetical protein